MKTQKEVGGMAKEERNRSIAVDFTIRCRVILDLDVGENGSEYVGDERVRELLYAELGDEIGQLDIKGDVQSVDIRGCYDYEDYDDLCDVDDGERA